MSDLHERIAKALGWSVKDAQSLSMQALRELVRPVDPGLASELDYMIRSKAYIRGEPLRPKRRAHATAIGHTKIWQRHDWTAPGATEPSKIEWQYVRDATADTADRWLAIYRRDEPDAVFVTSPTKPRGKKGPKILKGPGFTY